MKFKGHSTIAIMVIIALLGLMIPKVTVDAIDHNFEYIDNGDGTAAITGYNGSEGGDIVIPSELNGLTVTSIRDGDYLNSAFKSLSIKTLTLPDSLEYIGSYAFMDNELESVEIPDNVTAIGLRAFMDNEIRSLVLPDGLKEIIGSAFVNNSLESLIIPDSVTTIGASAFQNNNLESLTIPSSVTEIGNAAFSSNNLTSVDIPDSVTVIGGSVFYRNNLKSIEIPDSVTEIRQSSFRENSLESVTIPDSVTNIGNYAFQENNLTSVTILNDAVDFGSNVFRDNAMPLNLYGWDGSTTEDYANNRGYTFFAVDAKPDVTIMYDEEEVGNELSLNYEQIGQLEANYNHPIANIEQVVWIVNGSEASTNETLDISDYTSTPQSLAIELHVETEYGAVGEASVEITIMPPVPSTPSISVDSIGETEVSLSWNSVSFAEEYILVRDGEQVYRGTSTSYEDIGLDPGTTYNYSLVAVNASGASEASVVDQQTRYPLPNNIDFELQDHEGNNLLQDSSLDEVWFTQDLYVDVTVDGHEDDTYEYAFVPQGESVSDWQSGWNGERLAVMDSIEGDGALDLHVRITNGDGEVVEAVFGPIQIDQTPPALALAGAKEIVMEVGTRYDEPGYTAFDEREGETMDLTDAVQVNGSVDPDTPGEYTITYTVTDDAGNTTVQERTIHVVDILGLDIDEHTRDVAIGETVALVAEPIYADHITADITYSMHYESSDGTIATVDGEGYISFHDRGDVEITVSYGPLEEKVMFAVDYPTINTGERRDIIGRLTYRIHGLEREVVITMPSDLPEHTSVRVETYDVNEDNSHGLNQAGPVLTFTFDYGSGDAPDDSDPFTLTMAYDEHVSEHQIGVYYLNESDESPVWAYRGGEVDAANQTMTINVSHFSTYGVFEDTEGPDIHTFDAVANTDRVTLNFDASDASGITAYHIERDGTRIDTLNGDAKEYVDEGLREDMSYTYKLIAVDPLGNTSQRTLTLETIDVTEEEEIPEKDVKEEGGSESGAVSGTVEKNRPSGSNPSETSGMEETLPNTATSYYNIILISIILLVLGITMLMYGIWRKKMNDESSKV
ncbi:leucine-rich repeat protein [Amphibacillus jilinensis]|uniref:leucine-rich repeat protein n=1 Tax=Amphibacillus jilinensis TaxID=1216008 RepID=UPI000369D01F|nr:leucine-rich repeat protein [Amphibacillus jilinensis]